MPIEYDIIEDQQLVLARGSGVVTGIDVIRHLESLAADKRYTAPMKKIIDYRFIDSINISSEEAVKIALKKDTFSNKFLGEKCVFISPGNDTYSASRVHQSLIDSSSIDTAVFRQIEKALEWLEITLDTNLEKWLEPAQ
jgi:hypothetical protein